MLILRDVHYVEADGRCRRAFVDDHGVDTADLYVYRDPDERMPWPGRPLPSLEDFLGREVHAVVYDERGAAGTWHVEDNCPFKTHPR